VTDLEEGESVSCRLVDRYDYEWKYVRTEDVAEPAPKGGAKGDDKGGDKGGDKDDKKDDSKAPDPPKDKDKVEEVGVKG
jgi:hypothetical protein